MARGERVIQKGFVADSQAWRIHNATSETPRSPEDVARLSGLTRRRVVGHYYYWIRLGQFYGRTPDGKYFRDLSKEQPGPAGE